MDDVATSSQWSKLAIISAKHHYLRRDIILDDLEMRTGGGTGRVLGRAERLALHPGHIYGLIGRNGTGKTTFMRLLAQHRIEGLQAHLRVVYVDDEGLQYGLRAEQHDEGLTAADFVLSQHTAYVTLQRALQAALEGGDCDDGDDCDPAVLTSICEELAWMEADNAPAKAAMILSAVGVPPESRLSTLSGGWRHRVALAAALLVPSDVLLLDEPTNHLDLHGILWLERFLAEMAAGPAAAHGRHDGRQPPIIVVVSHDFTFLDNVASNVIQLAAGTITQFTGNYSRYLETQQAKMAKHERMFRAQEQRRRRLSRAIEVLQQRAAACPSVELGGAIRSRERELTTRLGASMDNVYWKYGLMGPRPEILAPPTEEPLEITLDTDVSDVPSAAGKGEVTLVRLDEANWAPARGAPNVLHAPASIHVTLSTRLLLVGRNGTGKSTILRLIAGALQPTTGTRLVWDGLRVGSIPQHAVEQLAAKIDGGPPVTALAYLLAEAPDAPSRHAGVKALQAFGLVGPTVEEQPLATLSAGQRARVLFATVMMTKPHVLLLDEPTSHLDAETASALCEALQTFEGALVVATHDATLIGSLNGSVFSTDAGSFGPYRHTAERYLLELREVRQKEERAELAEAAPRKTAPKKRSGASPTTAQQSEGPQGLPQTDTNAVRAGNVAPVADKAPVVAAVRCRHCGGPHFSSKCAAKPVDAPTDGACVMPAGYNPVEAAHDAVRLQQHLAKPKRPVRPPPAVEKAHDGKGNWKVADGTGR